MFKKGGVFLSILLCAVIAFAQTNVDNLFQPNNPNLVNLGEATEYTGSPMVYIQGMRAPEKATNDFEALQLKMFGTKNVQEATKNNLKLSDISIQAPENQILNYTFQTPFHQTVQSAFIPHIANFMTMIQVLNQDQITVSEHVVLINTKEDQYWTREILLPPHASAQNVSYLQNDQLYPVSSDIQHGSLTLVSPVPLQLGPNHLTFKYNIEHPFENNHFNIQLVNQESPWPIEQFKTLILFPTPIQINESKLLFGTNKLDIPNIYTQQVDNRYNINITINRVVPPQASIDLQMQFETNMLPTRDHENSHIFVAWGTVCLLIIYWLVFAFWERYRIQRAHLPHIKYPRNIAVLAHQMGTQITPQKWQQLIDFGAINKWPLDKLLREKKEIENNASQYRFKIPYRTFWSLMMEPVCGTALICLGAILALFIMTNTTFNYWFYFGLIIFCVIGVIMLYVFALKPIRKLYWQLKLAQLSNDAILTGLTINLVRQIYPLFILAQKTEEWCKNLTIINPKIAQETHLYKETK